jgi:PD-(D/E)XK nuclease superfamily protein
MKDLFTDIDSHLSRGTLVFPSEIAAEFWRRAAIGSAGRVAVRENALISWDTFKETAFDLRQENIPTNRTTRTVFAERIIRENAAAPVLRELVPPAFASEALGFTATIEAVLPRIPAALSAMQAVASERLLLIRGDLELLRERYTGFMNEHGLYEPRWLEAGRHFRGGSYQLVAPGLADDFPDFRAALSDLPRFDPGESTETELVVFDDSKSEMRSVLAAVAKLLDAGTDPEDIFLTVGDLDTLADRLRQEGEKYQIPLAIRYGRTLADSAVGRFIRDIGEVVSSGFAVGATERLVLNCGLPWLDPARNAVLVESGTAAGAIGGTGRPDPRWDRVGKSGGDGKPAEVLDYLRRLLPRITKASSFGELSSVFNEFLSRTVVRVGWCPDDERVLQRSQEELRTLVTVESDTGLIVENPYRFWLDRLGEHPYVAQHPGAGVAVLPYRVGAATYPRHHFVMNATHAATAVVVRPFPFLSEADRDDLGTTVSDRDLSVPFLNAYSVSGETVSFSASRSTFEGSALPAGFFVSSGRMTDAPAEEVARARVEDRYLAEEQFGPAVSPPAVSPIADSNSAGSTEPLVIQAIGAAAYMQGASTGSGPEFTRDRIDDPAVLEAALRRVRSKANPELIVLSASHIDSFRACPFGYLLSRGLRLNEIVLEVSPDDSMELGRLYHDILAEFFDQLARTETRFTAADLPAHRKDLSAIADRLYAQRRGMIPDIVYDANRETFDRISDALLQHDALMIDGHNSLLIEAWQQELETEDGFVLVGRVDRVTQAPDGSITLVDYKKSRLPTIKSVNAGSASALGPTNMRPADRAEQTAQLGSVQVPLYVRLLESGERQVTAAGYFGLETARYLSVFSESPLPSEKACMSRERLDEVMGLVDELVVSIAARVNAGDFTCNDDCSGCSLRSVCRTQFYVR